MKKLAIDRKWACIGFMTALLCLLYAPGRGSADEASEANRLVDQAETTLKNFLKDPDMKWFASRLQEAKGIFIVPRLTKGAFIFGLEGGNGVVLARDGKTGAWSEPVFYETSAASFGLQAGAEVAEAIVVIRTSKAVDSLMAGKLTLGVDGSADKAEGDGSQHKPID
jgi:lipid-binding SYLF domain-containing protein